LGLAGWGYQSSDHCESAGGEMINLYIKKMFCLYKHILLSQLLCLGLAQQYESRGNLLWLQMEINSDSFISVAHVPVEIIIIDGRYTISPSHLNLRLDSNSYWKLYANFEPNINNKYPFALSLRADKGIWNILWDYPISFRQGYEGHMSFGIQYRLIDPLPPDGHFTGTITYTLHRQ
jgi:hypothetical protein